MSYFSFAHSCLATHRGRDRGLFPKRTTQAVLVGRRDDEARLQADNSRVVHPRLGRRPHLERDQAVVGRRPQGVRARHVERHRLSHQLALRGHDRAQARRLLQGEFVIIDLQKGSNIVSEKLMSMHLFSNLIINRCAIFSDTTCTVR